MSSRQEYQDQDDGVGEHDHYYEEEKKDEGHNDNDPLLRIDLPPESPTRQWRGPFAPTSPLSTLFGSLHGTFSPAASAREGGQTNYYDTASLARQTGLLVFLSVLVVTVVVINYMTLLLFSSTTPSPMMDSSQTMMGLGSKANVSHATNILGFYHVPLPESLTKDHAAAAAVVVDTTSQSFLAADKEAQFLRFFILPTEEVDVEEDVQALGDDTTAMASTVVGGSKRESAKNTPSDVLLAIAAQAAQEGSPINTTTTTNTTKKEILMKRRGRLFKAPRMLARELMVTTQEDVLQPVRDRWVGRLDAVKRTIRTIQQHTSHHHNNKKDSSSKKETAIQIVKEEPTALANFFFPPKHMEPRAQLTSILGLDLRTPGSTDNGAEESTFGGYSPRKGHPLAWNIPRIPNILGVGTGRSVCPTSLFCFYKLPPTVQVPSGSSIENQVICETHCGRCFETKTELQAALRAYLADPTNHTSHVAQTYGWPIQYWCTSLITDFSHLFVDAVHFNEPLDYWDVSSATTVQGMFRNATHFNQPLSYWDVANVRDMSMFLANATAFNQPLNHLDVSNVETLESTLEGASSFRQSLARWKVGQVQDFRHLFAGASRFNGDLSKWNTTCAQTMQGMFRNATAFAGKNLTGWNVNKVTDLSVAFSGCQSFQPAADSLKHWHTAQVTSLRGTFAGTTRMKKDAGIGSWNTARVADFSHCFDGASNFDHSLANWTFDKATTLKAMFRGAKAYNQPMDTWDLRNVRDVSYMFQNATSFEQDLSSWQIGRVTDLSYAWDGATKFNVSLAGFNSNKWFTWM